MQDVSDSDKAKARGENAPAEPNEFQKRIGSTTYKVSVHFSKTSNETLSDKIRRLILNEAAGAWKTDEPPSKNPKPNEPQTKALTAGKEKE